MSPVDVWFYIALGVAAAAVNIYPFVYLARPWWVTPAGRALMVKAWGNLILIDMSVAFAIWGDYTGRYLVRAIGMTVFAAGMVYLLVVLLTTPNSQMRRWSSPPTLARLGRRGHSGRPTATENPP